MSLIHYKIFVQSLFISLPFYFLSYLKIMFDSSYVYLYDSHNSSLTWLHSIFLYIHFRTKKLILFCLY